MGPLGAMLGLRKAPRTPWESLLGGSRALQEPKKSCEEGPLIVLEVRYDPVLTKRGPQEGPKRAPREAQNDSWTGDPQKQKNIEKPMVFE